MHLTGSCSAPPDAAYDLVADLGTHVNWAGTQQTSNFRLVSLEAPPGPAGVGTTFTSTGTIPMSSRRWQDRSQVTVAERPNIFEFVTTATARGARRSMEATYRHRYEIESTPGGSKVSYSMTQLKIANPMLRLGLPVVKDLSWRFATRSWRGADFGTCCRPQSSALAAETFRACRQVAPELRDDLTSVILLASGASPAASSA